MEELRDLLIKFPQSVPSSVIQFSLSTTFSTEKTRNQNQQAEHNIGERKILVGCRTLKRLLNGKGECLRYFAFRTPVVEQ